MTDAVGAIKFLLVDDLEENLLALEALLQREGLVCLKARTGEQALEFLLQHDVALALLDVQMPGMDGFELAEFMRGSERTRRVPIIFLTAGAADTQRRFRGYETGAVDFIHKPVEADILRSKTNVFFELHQQRRQIEAQRDELEVFAETLSAANRRKNEFLAVLGHELRNPVTSLRAGLSLLERYNEDGEKTRMVRERMERGVAHLTRLVEDLLDISRIDQGKILLRKERVALKGVVEFAIEQSQSHIEAGHHNFEANIVSEAVWVHGDPARLSQVVSNLLINAAKYTPAYGAIRLVARKVDGLAEIEIADNGVGIPPNMQQRIFELFEQLSASTPNAAEGLGVGLALVKQLLELHNGTILLTSAGENRGSTFTVRLPTVV